MGRLDIAFKDFLKQKHVLASLAEVMIFQSKGIIRPENVTILDTVQAKLDTKNRRNHKELIQDVVCRIDTIAGDRYICFRLHLEPMSYIDCYMLSRNMEYSANDIMTQIRKQIAEIERAGRQYDKTVCNPLTHVPHNTKIEPIRSLVINLNKHKWEGFTNSIDMTNDELARMGFFPTIFGILLVLDPHTISDELLNMMIPELKLIFLAVRYQAKEYSDQLNELLSSSKVLINQQMATVLSALLNRNIKVPEKGEITMCEAMDVIAQRIENKGIKKGEASGIRKGIRQGIRQGMQQGILQGKLETVVSMYRKGKLTVDECAEELGMTVNQFLAEAGMN